MGNSCLRIMLRGHQGCIVFASVHVFPPLLTHWVKFNKEKKIFVPCRMENLTDNQWFLRISIYFKRRILGINCLIHAINRKSTLWKILTFYTFFKNLWKHEVELIYVYENTMTCHKLSWLVMSCNMLPNLWFSRFLKIKIDEKTWFCRSNNNNNF